MFSMHVTRSAALSLAFLGSPKCNVLMPIRYDCLGKCRTERIHDILLFICLVQCTLVRAAISYTWKIERERSTRKSVCSKQAHCEQIRRENQAQQCRWWVNEIQQFQFPFPPHRLTSTLELSTREKWLQCDSFTYWLLPFLFFFFYHRHSYRIAAIKNDSIDTQSCTRVKKMWMGGKFHVEVRMILKKITRAEIDRLKWKFLELSIMPAWEEERYSTVISWKVFPFVLSKVQIIHSLHSRAPWMALLDRIYAWGKK